MFDSNLIQNDFFYQTGGSISHMGDQVWEQDLTKPYLNI
jgi:hypothetical protein